MDKKQLNSRVSAEGVSRFNSIVNYYRAHIPVGRISKDAVMEEIINFAYNAMKSQQQTGAPKQTVKPPLVSRR